MSLIAYLQIGNNDIEKYSQEYPLKDVSCKFIRNHNSYRPIDDAFCQCIYVSAFAQEKLDISLYNWYINGESQDGRIIIEMSDPLDENNYDITTIKFNNAYCFELKEDFEKDTKRRVVTLGLVATETTVDDVKFNR